MKDLLIRSYAPSDLEACRHLYAMLTRHHGEIYEDPSMGGEDAGQAFDQHLDRAGAERTWVADAGGEVIGFTSLLVNEQEAEVEPIVILPEHRGKTIGQALLQQAIAEARRLGVPLVCAKPVARNIEALAFFRRAGFKAVGHVQVFMELTPEPLGRWRPGLNILGNEFEY